MFAGMLRIAVVASHVRISPSCARCSNTLINKNKKLEMPGGYEERRWYRTYVFKKLYKLRQCSLFKYINDNKKLEMLEVMACV